MEESTGSALVSKLNSIADGSQICFRVM